MPRDYGYDLLPPTQFDIMRQIARRQTEPVSVDFRRGLRQGAEIDDTMPTMQMPRVISPLDVLGATGSATGRAMGSLVDKPGNVRDAIFEAGKGVRDALSGKGVTSPSMEMQKRTGVETPGLANFFMDTMLDVGNVADPMKMFLPVAGMATHSDDLIRELAKKGLESLKKPRAIESILPKVESEILPKVESAIPKTESQVIKSAETHMPTKGQGTLFDDLHAPNPVDEEIARQGNLFQNMPPEIKEAGFRATQATAQSAKAGKLARTLAEVGKSGSSVIEDAGRTGPALNRLILKTRSDAMRLAGEWRARVNDITKDLTPTQVVEYVKARDTGAVSQDPAVISALEKRNAFDDEITSHAGALGAELKMSGKPVDVGGWPRIYTEKFMKDKDTIIQQLLDQGLTPKEAEKTYARSHNLNQRLIDPRTGEQMSVPGYRTDLAADQMHVADMAERIVNARNFGTKDIEDASSPISQLIAGTNDPERIRELVKRQLGKEAPATSQSALNSTVRGLIKVQTAMHLSQFALSNISNAVAIPLRGNTKAFAKALGNTILKFKNSAAEAGKTGALETISQDILREVGGESVMSKMYGMKGSETFNRTLAALTGKGTAEELFNTLKKNPKNKIARARLDNLLLEDVNTVLKQDSLNPDQIGRAGARMSEITQGLAQSIDLPKMWTDHPAMDLILLFKKYAFRQSRIIADAIKENPARNIPLALALYSGVGEVVGDTKATIKGLTSGKGPGQEIQDRGQGLERLANNLGQSWAFGLIADALSSAHRGPVGAIQFMGGPVAGDIAELTGNVASGNPKGVAKQAAGAVPFIGPGLRSNDKLWKKGPSGKGTRLPTLPKGTRLPRL